MADRWKGHRACDGCVLLEDIGRCGAEKEETIENTRFEHPTCGHFGYFFTGIFSTAGAKETGDGGQEVLRKENVSLW